MAIAAIMQRIGGRRQKRPHEQPGQLENEEHAAALGRLAWFLAAAGAESRERRPVGRGRLGMWPH